MKHATDRWSCPPNLPTTHFLDNRIYTESEIFSAERERLFTNCWKFLCLESEIPDIGDYRVSELAGVPIVTVRAADGVHSYFNVCPHRGAPLVRDERGNLARGFQCMYHLWTFSLKGDCTSISRIEGYEAAGLKKQDVGLRPVRTETVCGLVFLCLNDDVEPTETFFGDMLDHIKLHMGSEELEVFHYHRAEIKTNWKLWVDNNSEIYHDFMHILNRKTGIAHPNYHERRWKLYPNSHNVILEGTMDYESGGFDDRDRDTMPGIGPNGMVIMEVFPDVMFNIRATAMRIDSITPLEPGLSLVEFRGVGLKSDTPEIRETRIRHHNQIWGPAGRNLPEDVAVVEAQWKNMDRGGLPFSIFAREEELRPHDDSNLRAYYQEWGRRVSIWPHDTTLEYNGDSGGVNDRRVGPAVVGS
jgi:phenylpropionate dioxygenase-like ring-hydroxylating dioxygenase large terminal subunit